MQPLKFSLFVLLFLFARVGNAQEAKDTMSLPLDIPATGWNKVLCMKNGYTMLFHFEPEKAMTVIVFDSTHKKVADRKQTCRTMDFGVLRTSVVKGLYEIGGEAVLFVEQEHMWHHQLVRVRFEGRKGNVLEEKVLGESQGVNKPTRFFVVKNKDNDSYSVLFCNEYPQFKECKIYLSSYNSRHELTVEIPLQVDRKKYDYLEPIGLEWQPAGIMVTMVLSTLKQNGTPSHPGTYDPVPDLYDHYLSVYYIPKGSTHAKNTIVNVTTDVFPYYSMFSYNPFAQSLNLYALSYQDAFYRYGVELLPAAMIKRLFLKIDEDFSPHFNWITDEKANDYYQRYTDSSKVYVGLPLKMFTNDNGLSTVVSESYERYNYNQYGRGSSIDHQRSHVFESYLGPIGITQFDDDGHEIWGAVLPRSQYLKSYKRYYLPSEFSKQRQNRPMFGDWPPEVYARQFLSFNTYSYNKNLYIIYNDYDKNYYNTLKNPGDTVYDFERTNALCYKVDSKKEMTKYYLFGAPKHNEYRASLIEGADFDEKNGVYATLVQQNRANATSLRMAWQHLE